jgi:hypothetical protein
MLSMPMVTFEAGLIGLGTDDAAEHAPRLPEILEQAVHRRRVAHARAGEVVDLVDGARELVDRLLGRLHVEPAERTDPADQVELARLDPVEFTGQGRALLDVLDIHEARRQRRRQGRRLRQFERELDHRHLLSRHVLNRLVDPAEGQPGDSRSHDRQRGHQSHGCIDPRGDADAERFALAGELAGLRHRSLSGMQRDSLDEEAGAGLLEVSEGDCQSQDCHQRRDIRQPKTSPRTAPHLNCR